MVRISPAPRRLLRLAASLVPALLVVAGLDYWLSTGGQGDHQHIDALRARLEHFFHVD